MTPQRISAREAVEFEDLRALAVAEGPCITVAVTIPDPLQIRTRIRDGIRDLKKQMIAAGISGKSGEILAGPIDTLAASADSSGFRANQLVIYRSPNIFRYFSLSNQAEEFVSVGDRFQVRLLLSMVSREQRFYLLELSQKQVSLFRCTRYNIEPVELRAYTPKSLQAWMNARTPDHVLENRAAGGQGIGSMQGVVFGTNTDRERRVEYLHHFFKEVDSGIRRALRGESTPMIVAGVQEETAIYRRVNSYAELMADSVHGSPDGMPALELHQRALEIIQRTLSTALRRVLHDFDANRGTRRVVQDVPAALKAAHEGRVSALLLRDHAEYRGTWDEAMARIQPGEDDLLNQAALMTLLHTGQVFSLQSSDVPEGVDAAAALLRY